MLFVELRGSAPRARKGAEPRALRALRPHQEGDSAFWTKIGGTWKRRDGKGFNIQLSCMPLNGRLVIREPKADVEAGR